MKVDKTYLTLKMSQQSHSFREIITINVGGFGVNIGQTTLKQYCVEQGISSNGDKECKTKYDDTISTSFKETKNGKYTARSLFIDLEPYSINMMKNMYKYSKVLQNDYLIAGKRGSHHNYATAHYCYGKEYISDIMDKMRLMVEECDNFQGIIINNSMSGGTGSGLGALCLERIAVDYWKYTMLYYQCISYWIKRILQLYWIMLKCMKFVEIN